MLRGGLLVIAVAMVAACAGGGAGDDVAGPATSSPDAPSVELEGETLDGGRLSLADFRGTPVFVNVWASW